MENTNESAKVLFESVTEYHVLISEELSSNFLHTNFLITTNTSDSFVVRLPNYKYADENDFKDEFKISRKTQKYQFDVPCLYFDLKEGYKITKYIKTTASLNNNIDDNFIIKLAKDLKCFHTLPYELDIIFNPLLKLQDMLKSLETELSLQEEEKVNEVTTLFNKYPQVYCHNYLNPTNVLIKDNEVYFINYMYFGLNIALYDLAFILRQAGINENNKIINFLSSYFDKEYNENIFNDYQIMVEFTDIMWKYYGLIKIKNEI